MMAASSPKPTVTDLGVIIVREIDKDAQIAVGGSLSVEIDIQHDVRIAGAIDWGRPDLLPKTAIASGGDDVVGGGGIDRCRGPGGIPGVRDKVIKGSEGGIGFSRTDRGHAGKDGCS